MRFSRGAMPHEMKPFMFSSSWPRCCQENSSEAYADHPNARSIITIMTIIATGFRSSRLLGLLFIGHSRPSKPSPFPPVPRRYARSGGFAFGRRHEFRSYWIFNGLGQDAIDGVPAIVVDRPPQNLAYRRKLLGPPSAPKGDGRALVQHPADREREHVLAVALPCEVIELRTALR